jgi:hypothetical protein
LSLDLYMSEVLKYNRATLGSAERLFLNLLMTDPKKPRSTYGVWTILRKRGNRMAYKNVYTRIKTLEKLNLIEKVSEKSKYGALRCRLTTQGLFHQVSRFANIDESISWTDFLDYYSDNIIFKTLIIPYFEKDTIKHANSILYFELVSYLRGCYQITLDAADRIRRAIEEHNKEDEEYYTKRMKEKLEWQPKSFAFELLTRRLKEARGNTIIGRLAKDKKFVGLLREVQKDFEKGFIAVKGIHDRYYSNNYS